MKKIIYLTILTFGMMMGSAYSQIMTRVLFKDLFYQADEYMVNENYAAALPLLNRLSKYDSTDANIQHLIGICHLKADKNEDLAIDFLEKATANVSEKYEEYNFKERRAPIITWFYLGQAYHLNYEFDKAIDSYISFKKLLGDKNEDQLKEVQRQIAISKRAKEMVKNPIRVKLTNLGDLVNSDKADYNPVITGNNSTLIFTSRNNTSTGNLMSEDGLYFEDIVITKKVNGSWRKAISIGANLNTAGHDASVSVSPDGQFLYIYKDDKLDGNVYLCELEGNEWKNPEKIVQNTKSWEPHAAISSDGNTLYFTSDKKGGYGGRDIYYSEKQQNGSWGPAINMGMAVNTEFDEDGPLMSADDNTLYFSSNGHETMGGFDLFTSSRTKGGWARPVNIGYPLNTPDDDVFFSTTPGEKIAYYSSKQAEGVGEKDIYEIEFLDRKETPLWVISGVVNYKYDKHPPKDAKIEITNITSKKPTTTAKINSSSGEYLYILKPGNTYDLKYYIDKDVFRKETITVPQNTDYKEITDDMEIEKDRNKKNVLASKSDELKDIPKTIDQAPEEPIVSIPSETKMPLMPKTAPANSRADELAKQRREQFLDEIADKYPEGFSVATFDHPDYKLERIVHKDKDGKAHVYDKKEWNWGGTYFFMDGDIDMTKNLYDRALKLAGKELAGITESSDDKGNKESFKVGHAKRTDNPIDINGIFPKEVIPEPAHETAKSSTSTKPENKTKYLPGVDALEVTDFKTDDDILRALMSGHKIILRNIHFDYDRSTLRSESFPELNKVYSLLSKYPDLELEVGGHTDSKGSDEYNLNLSQNRSASVVQYLNTKGIKQKRLAPKGYGEFAPIAPNENFDGSDNPEGRQLNRRVEIGVPNFRKASNPDQK